MKSFLSYLTLFTLHKRYSYEAAARHSQKSTPDAYLVVRALVWFSRWKLIVAPSKTAKEVRFSHVISTIIPANTLYAIETSLITAVVVLNEAIFDILSIMKPLTPASPHAIIMVGIPGSGKSTFAERFADTFQAPIVSQTKLQLEFGLSLEAAEALRDFILGEYMKTHRTVLIDGGFERKPKREELVKRLVKAGYRPMVVWVQTDTTESLRRAMKPYPRGSSIDPTVFDELVDRFDAPSEKEKMVVISGKHTYNSQLKIVLKQLTIPDHSQPRLPPVSPPEVPPEVRPPRSRNVFIR